jgi:hypothetical protein
MSEAKSVNSAKLSFSFDNLDSVVNSVHFDNLIRVGCFTLISVASDDLAVGYVLFVTDCSGIVKFS